MRPVKTLNCLINEYNKNEVLRTDVLYSRLEGLKETGANHSARQEAEGATDL